MRLSRRPAGTPPKNHDGERQEARTRLRNLHAADRAEQALRFALDSRGEVQHVRIAAVAAVAEGEAPQSGVGDGVAHVVAKLAEELSRRRIEGTDASVALISDQQRAGELAEG